MFNKIINYIFLHRKYKIFESIKYVSLDSLKFFLSFDENLLSRKTNKSDQICKIYHSKYKIYFYI